MASRARHATANEIITKASLAVFGLARHDLLPQTEPASIVPLRTMTMSSPSIKERQYVCRMAFSTSPQSSSRIRHSSQCLPPRHTTSMILALEPVKSLSILWILLPVSHMANRCPPTTIPGPPPGIRPWTAAACYPYLITRTLAIASLTRLEGAVTQSQTSIMV